MPEQQELESSQQRSLVAAAKKIFYRRNLSDYFSNELKIRTKNIGLAPFIPNPVQVPLLKVASRQLSQKGKIRIVIPKCRQPGISTFTSGIISNRTFLYSGVYSFIVAQDKTTAGNLFQIYDVMYRNLSSDIQPELQYFNKDSDMTVLPESGGLGSKILIGEAKNMHVGTGQTIHCLGLSEVCRYPSSESLKDSLIPACSDAPGTVRIYESTAHFGGGADWFRYQCDRARAGDEDIEYHFVEWWKMPEYAIPLLQGEKLKLTTDEKYFIKKIGITLENVKWRRAKIRDLEGDTESFKMSFPFTFEEMWINRNTSAFPQDRVMELHNMIRPPILRLRAVNMGNRWELLAHEDGELSIWKEPAKGKIYDIGADIAEGHDDGDYSAAEVIERGTNEQAAEWHGHIMPMEFAEILACIGRYYNNAQIAPETNSNMSACRRLGEIYVNVYIWRKQDTLQTKMTNLLGWETSHKSKQMLVELAHHRLYYRQVKIYSQKLWNEMRNFGRDYTDSGNVTYRAMTGHDDLVMSWIIALKTSDDENFERYHSSSVGDGKPVEPVKKPEAHLVDSEWSPGERSPRLQGWE